MARSPQYEQGRRNGIKACVEWLHAWADEMNDAQAKAFLNTAAWNMGVEFKAKAPSSSEGDET